MSTVVAAEVTDAALLENALRTGASALIVPPELVSTVQLRGRTALVRGDAPAGLGVRGIDPADIVSVSTPDELRSALARGANIVSIDVAAVVDAALVPFAEVARPAPFALDNVVGREPIVLLSGMLGDASVWDDVAEGIDDLLAPRTIRIDLDDSIVEIADSVLAQAPSRFVLGGHSLGGIVALEIVRRAPDRVTGLVLVATSAREPNDGQRASWAAVRARVENGEFVELAVDLARATLGPRSRDDADLVATNAQMAQSVGPDGLLRQLSAQESRTDNLTLLPDIRVPVLVVSGDTDEICPPHLQQEIAEHCASAELITVAGSGHMITLEQPQAVVDAIRAWYDAQ